MRIGVVYMGTTLAGPVTPIADVPELTKRAAKFHADIKALAVAKTRRTPEIKRLLGEQQEILRWLRKDEMLAILRDSFDGPVPPSLDECELIRQETILAIEQRLVKADPNPEAVTEAIARYNPVAVIVP